MLRNQALNQKLNRYYKIRGGNDLLPKAFAARLTEKIHYAAPVVRIEQSAQGVKAVFLQGSSYQTLTGDYLVCAVPFTVQRNIEVAPAFSVEKQRAIEQLPYLAASQVFLQSREEVLGRRGPQRLRHDRSAHRSGVGRDVQATGRPRHLTSLPDQPALAAGDGAGGAGADQLRARTGGNGLPRHPRALRGRRDEVLGRGRVGARRQCYYKPGQFGSLLPHVARPEGRIHFAGEHTSVWIDGWMQGRSTRATAWRAK
jgi:monoamine oxidase